MGTQRKCIPRGLQLGCLKIKDGKLLGARIKVGGQLRNNVRISDQCVPSPSPTTENEHSHACQNVRTNDARLIAGRSCPLDRGAWPGHARHQHRLRNSRLPGCDVRSGFWSPLSDLVLNADICASAGILQDLEGAEDGDPRSARDDFTTRDEAGMRRAAGLIQDELGLRYNLV